MPVRVGTSGWQYRDWRGVLYPAGLAERDWLERYASRYGVFVYFNNDQHAAALHDAAAFASLARRAGRQVTATPTPRG